MTALGALEKQLADVALAVLAPKPCGDWGSARLLAGSNANDSLPSGFKFYCSDKCAGVGGQVNVTVVVVDAIDRHMTPIRKFYFRL